MAFKSGVSYGDIKVNSKQLRSFNLNAPVQQFQREFKLPPVTRVTDETRAKFEEPSMFRHCCVDNLPILLAVLGVIAGASFIGNDRLGAGIVLIIVSVGFCGFMYPRYYRSSLKVTEFKELTWMTESDLEKLLATLSKAKPTLSHKVECYKVVPNQYGQNVDVVSFSETTSVPFKSELDYSPLVEFESYSAQVLKLHFSNQFRAGDQSTEADFKMRKDALIATHKHRDEKCRCVDVYEIPNVPPVVMINRANDESVETPFWFSPRIYFCCTLMGLAAPYRYWVESSYVKERLYTSLKALFLGPKDESQQREINRRKEDQYAMV